MDLQQLIQPQRSWNSLMCPPCDCTAVIDRLEERLNIRLADLKVERDTLEERRSEGTLSRREKKLTVTLGRQMDELITQLSTVRLVRAVICRKRDSVCQQSARSDLLEIY